MQVFKKRVSSSIASPLHQFHARVTTIVPRNRSEFRLRNKETKRSVPNNSYIHVLPLCLLAHHNLPLFFCEKRIDRLLNCGKKSSNFSLLHGQVPNSGQENNGPLTGGPKYMKHWGYDTPDIHKKGKPHSALKAQLS